MELKISIGWRYAAHNYRNCYMLYNESLKKGLVGSLFAPYRLAIQLANKSKRLHILIEKEVRYAT